MAALRRERRGKRQQREGREPAPGGAFLRRGALQDDTLFAAGWLWVCRVKGRLEGKPDSLVCLGRSCQLGD